MPKHTPGPWKMAIARRPVNPVDGWIIKRDDDAQFPICLVAETIGGTNPPQKANAHLISAAPDLLEALQVLLECPQLQGEQAFSATKHINRARAAINKALGK